LARLPVAIKSYEISTYTLVSFVYSLQPVTSNEQPATSNQFFCRMPFSSEYADVGPGRYSVFKISATYSR
jgi:hypothetical protein